MIDVLSIVLVALTSFLFPIWFSKYLQFLGECVHLIIQVLDLVTNFIVVVEVLDHDFIIIVAVLLHNHIPW